MKLIFSLLLIMLGGFISCNQNNCDNPGDPNTCSCYDIYAPVCGCDGVTYENDCRSECAGITEFSEGSCQ